MNNAENQGGQGAPPPKPEPKPEIGAFRVEGEKPKRGEPAVDTTIHSPMDIESQISAAIAAAKKEIEGAADDKPDEKPPPEPSKDDKKPKEQPKEEPKDPPKDEPKVSARERFSKAAEEDRVKRENTDRLKAREEALSEREKAAEAALARLEMLEKDPIGFIDKYQPKLFERMVEVFGETGKKPGEKPEKSDDPAPWEARIKQLEERLAKKEEESQKQETQNHFRRTISDTKEVLKDEKFEPIHAYCELHQELYGVPVDIDASIANEFDTFKHTYGKELTPPQIAEILLETASEVLERMPKSSRMKALLGIKEENNNKTEPKPDAKKPKPRTLTNQQQAASATTTPNIDELLEGLDQEERIQKITELAMAGKLTDQ
jgi:hypothetical protein